MLDVMQTECAQLCDDAASSSAVQQRLREAGFTLVELVVVVAIAVMALAVGLPNLMRSKMRAEMLSQVKMTQQAFAVARINAVQGAAPVVLELRQGGMGWELYSWKDTGATPEVHDAGEPEVGRWSIPSSKFLVEQDPSAALRLYRLGGSATRRGVVFFPNGVGIVNEAGNVGVGQGGLRIADKKGNEFRLLVQSGTGTIIRQMWDPKNSTWDEKSLKHWRY
jgi:prepilin-type N-terminal cleavage/methylation domain-containing protein